MADTIKCPSCSGNLTFDADLQKLTCAYCGSSFLPEELSDDIVSNQLTSETSYDDSPASSTLDETTVVESDADIDYHVDDMQELVCNSCGAVLLTDKNTSATFCTFCGSPALAVNKLTKDFKPKYIIPFKYGREKAIESFFKWCKGGRMTPFGFVSDKNIEKLTGLYVPYWLFGAKATMDRTVDAHTVKRTTSGEYQTTTTSYYELERKGNFRWKNIPLDGETRIDDDLMEAIEPFDFHEMIDYDYKYLPGFYADAYDLDAKALEPRAIKRVHSYLESEFAGSVSKYNYKKVTSTNDSISEVVADYALLPVWFMSYQYLGKTYNFAMNGQTGEIAGIPPVSLVKKLIFFFLFLSIFTLIIKILIGLFLGGYVG